MALIASTVPSTPWFNSGPISFSELRSNFKETSSGSVSASELLRNTDTTNANPIVPDSTENSDIVTSTDLKISQFRDSIKYYIVTQSFGSTDVNLNAANSSLWNGNLTKNIKKTVTIAGTCGSTNGDPALSFDTLEAYNVLILIEGSVLATGGSGALVGGNGGNGGTALYINTNSTGTVTIKTTASAEVYGGGGGGGGGGKGGKGGNAQYNTYYTYYTSIGGGSGTFGGSYDQRCRSACSSVGGEWANNCYKHTSEGGQNCGGNTSDYWSAVCYSDDASSYASTTACRKTNTGTNVNNSTGGAGGAAVSGGNGRGYLQSKTNGAPYNTGLSGGTNAGTGGRSGVGGNGGDWGEGGTSINGENGVKGTDGTQGSASITAAPDFGETDGPVVGGLGGSAGAAVSGSNYIIDPTSVDSAFKGSK